VSKKAEQERRDFNALTAKEKSRYLYLRQSGVAHRTALARATSEGSFEFRCLKCSRVFQTKRQVDNHTAAVHRPKGGDALDKRLPGSFEMGKRR
jgi:phage FluMu protein Com